MDYTDIIKDITNNLTGDSRKDFSYLWAEADKYQDHEFSQEITRAIGRLFYKVMPNDMKQGVKKELSNIQLSSDSILAEVKFKISEGELDQAERMIKAELPPEGMYQEGWVNVYFAFNNPLEEIYYKSKFKPKKDIQIIKEIDTEIFHTYAYILIEKKKLDDAMAIIDRGLHYNPLDTRLLFEKGEIYKLKKDWDAFDKITALCMEYSYSSRNIARAYRNYGYMFVELMEYDVAICCYFTSLEYDYNSQMAQSQLFYISQKIDSKIKPEDYSDKVAELFNGKGIQRGANLELLKIALARGKQLEDNRELPEAYFFYSILYDLTKSKEIKDKLETIKKQIN